MLDPRFLRRQQGEEQVDRLSVYGAEGDGMFKADHHDSAALKPGDPGVRGRDAPAKSGGARLLPLKESRQDEGGIEVEVLGGLVGDEVHDLARRARAKAHGHGAGPDQVGDGKSILQSHAH